jgi:RNA polymerase sigma-70 factor (ECF subfamily)
VSGIAILEDYGQNETVPMDSSAGKLDLRAHNAAFVTTHWSVVLAAQKGSAASTQALARLCSVYWYPLYAYVRRRGHQEQDAQDLTQEFFARLLQRNALQSVSPDKGRFRSFLLASLKNFLTNEWDRRRAQKRGGGGTFVPLNWQIAENRYALESIDNATPEALYERRWALTLMEQVIARLRQEYTQNEKSGLFDQLKGFLSGEDRSMTYVELAAQHGVSKSAVKMAVLRLRQRYGQLLRQEIAHTVSTPEEVEEEIRHLIAVVG